MKKQFSITLLILMVAFGFLSLCKAQNKTPSVKEKIKIELIARYFNNGFYDISSDGKFILLFGASTPLKNSKSDGLTEWKPKDSEKYSKILRVVELESGREFGSITRTHGRPDDARFVQDKSQVCILDDKEIELWDYMTGLIVNCSAMPKPYQNISMSFYETRESPNSKYRSEMSLKKAADLLVVRYVRGVITLFDSDTGEKICVATHPTAKLWAENPTAGLFYGVALTQDNKYLVTYYGNDTYIWRISVRDGK